MSLNLPEAAAAYGTDWAQAGVYAILYDVPDDLTEAAENAFDNNPEWLEAAEEAANTIYVGEAGNVMSRLVDHNEGEYRKNSLTRLGCEPVSIEAIEYKPSKEAAVEAEYNTAVKLRNQTPDDTIIISNGELV